MSAKTERKYRRVINYIEDEVGADVDRDLLRMALVEQDISKLVVSNPDTEGLEVASFESDGLDSNVASVSGKSQTAADWTAIFQDLNSLTGALNQDEDALFIETSDPLDVSAATVTVGDNGEFSITDSSNNVIEEPLDVSDAVVTVEEKSPIDVNTGVVSVTEDSPLDVSASTVPVSEQNGGFQDPNSTIVGVDLIANSGASIGPVSVEGSQALVISATSTDANQFSASVKWTDGSGNVFNTESRTDIQFDSVTEDWARVVRKGTHAIVEFADESGGSSNNINAFAGAHR